MPSLLSLCAVNLEGQVFSPLLGGKALPEGLTKDSELQALGFLRANEAQFHRFLF